MSRSDDIFALISELKKLSAKAQGLELAEVQAVLNYACDRLVFEYQAAAGEAAEEMQSLRWDQQKWPSATAVLLEMKLMINAMAEAEASEVRAAGAGRD